jgi:demethyl-4-deoxygadusol synthase
MSQIEAKFVATDTAFRVEGYEKIEYDLLFVEGVFTKNLDVA